MENWQETIQNGLAEYGPGLLGFVAVLVIGWMVASAITGGMRKAMTKADVDAIIGAAGLAIGFALQGSLGNFAAGAC